MACCLSFTVFIAACGFSASQDGALTSCEAVSLCLLRYRCKKNCMPDCPPLHCIWLCHTKRRGGQETGSISPKLVAVELSCHLEYAIPSPRSINWHPCIHVYRRRLENLWHVLYVLADHVWSSQTRNVFALIWYCARDIEGSLLDGKKAFGRTFYSVLIETLLLHVIHCNVAQNVICGRIK